MILGGGVAVCLLLSVHRAVIFAIALLSCSVFRQSTYNFKPVIVMTQSEELRMHMYDNMITRMLFYQVY